MITGKEKPDSGTFKIGETVKLGYVDQSRDDLDPKKSIWEIISDGLDVVQLGKRQLNSRAYVARFNFSGSDQQKKFPCCQAERETACILRVCLRKKPMCFCLMNLPMIWM